MEDYHNFNTTPLIKACRRNQLDIVKDFWSKDHDCINYLDPANGATALHYACRHQSFDVFKWLIEHGACLSEKDHNGNTPLHLACAKSICFSELLLDNGARVNIKNNDGHFPIHIACNYNRLYIAKLLKKQGASIIMPDNDGATPLHYACDCYGYDYDEEDFELVKWLLYLDADPKKPDKDGKTPLDVAKETGTNDILYTRLKRYRKF